MKLIIHASTEKDCPENLRFLGHFISGKKLLPVRFSGATAELVAQAGADFIKNETEKLSRRSGAARVKE